MRQIGPRRGGAQSLDCAGHGQGKPIPKQIEELAGKMAFALHFVGPGTD